MAQPVISYDYGLPEIAGRLPWTPPDSHLIKDESGEGKWRLVPERRPSPLLLPPLLRDAVNTWRNADYPGASEVSRRLFHYWFEEEHEVSGLPSPFRYHFCQREAIETLIWLVEIFGERDTKALIETYGDRRQHDLVSGSFDILTRPDGRGLIRRFVPEIGASGEQDLPPDNLRRYAFKMATGSGKTWVMAMAMVWSYLHKRMIPGSALSRHFLVVAPNLTVYQRLEKDFANGRVFRAIPLVPPEWLKEFSLNVILRGEATDPRYTGNLFLTNIHRLYESRGEEQAPQNPVENLVGARPAKDPAAPGLSSMLDRIYQLQDLVVMNDEAHHVHDEELAWSRALLKIRRELPKGLALWLDYSATPKDQNGMFFPWTVCDYPLAQAVEDRIVKAPIIVDRKSDPARPAQAPDHITKENVTEKYGYWIRDAVQCWKRHWKTYRALEMKPVLFIIAERNTYADAIGEFLWKTRKFGFKQSEVLVIHTDRKGEIRKEDLGKARDIDQPGNPIKAIVSVMMLREGWDVRNVTVVLGLRPFTAKAEILPEQVIGRGLRLMAEISPDQTQTLEVLGTSNLLNVLREQLEAEGVGVAEVSKPPRQPEIVRPLKERMEHDIGIPITRPSLTHSVSRLLDLNLQNLFPIYDQKDLPPEICAKLSFEFSNPQVQVHEELTSIDSEIPTREILANIANEVIRRAGLPNQFALLYPIVYAYVGQRCFGKLVDVEIGKIRQHLLQPDIQDAIARYLTRQISQLTAERKPLEFERENFCLSETRPFSWRRNLPLFEARKTVFNRVATYNDFEKDFAKFLDRAPDVLRFAALGSTEQGVSGVRFRVDYLKPSGAIGFYHPDWVAVLQGDSGGEENWIIETKGRVWEDTESKEKAMLEWCRRVSEKLDTPWRYLRVNQSNFESAPPRYLSELTQNAAELPLAPKPRPSLKDLLLAPHPRTDELVPPREPHSHRPPPEFE